VSGRPKYGIIAAGRIAEAETAQHDAILCICLRTGSCKVGLSLAKVAVWGKGILCVCVNNHKLQESKIK
jgi:hypothetical protein